MAIAKHLEELKEQYTIYGYIKDADDQYQIEEFEANKTYTGYLVERK